MYESTRVQYKMYSKLNISALPTSESKLITQPSVSVIAFRNCDKTNKSSIQKMKK